MTGAVQYLLEPAAARWAETAERDRIAASMTRAEQERCEPALTSSDLKT